MYMYKDEIPLRAYRPEKRHMESTEERSPVKGDEPDRKRKRKVLSCTSCRKRKVSRNKYLHSCSRCVKAGRAASCVYEDESLPALDTGSNEVGHQPPNGIIQTGFCACACACACDCELRSLERCAVSIAAAGRTIAELRRELADLTSDDHRTVQRPLSTLSRFASSAGAEVEHADESVLFRGKLKCTTVAPQIPEVTLACTCGSPLKVEDEDLYDTTTQSPPSRS